MAPTNPAAAWTIQGQQETADIGPAGTYVAGVRVTFRLASGTVGTVFVPNADYNEANVRAAITDKAATMAAVANLQG